MKLLARFYDPDDGQRARSTARPARAWTCRASAASSATCPRRRFLFSGTVRDNIAYGRPDAERRRGRGRGPGRRRPRVHRRARPAATDHELSERGRSLSAGQRQLIALARAELVDPAILLLDEATSNLDLATEARVAAAMQPCRPGRTTVVIAHRLQTARSADRSSCSPDGSSEVGTHDELLALGGRYAAMWEASDLGLVRT